MRKGKTEHRRLQTEYFAGISVISRIKLCGEQAERIVEDDNKIE